TPHYRPRTRLIPYTTRFRSRNRHDQEEDREEQAAGENQVRTLEQRGNGIGSRRGHGLGGALHATRFQPVKIVTVSPIHDRQNLRSEETRLNSSHLGISYAVF